MSSAAAKPESGAPGRLFRFGVFEFHTGRRELRKHGVRIKISGQPISVLAMLLERPGEVITRDDLQRRLWPEGTYVDFEHGVNAAIKRLRHALGDSADSPRFIETVARSGYRFVAPVSYPVAELARPVAENHIDVPAVSDHYRHATNRRRLGVSPAVIAGVALLMVIAGAAAILHTRDGGRSSAGRIRSLAVLPLANLSGDPGEEYFVEGMADALRQQLESISALRVISRTSSIYYRGSSKPLPEIARQMNADAVVDGSVLRSGGRVRINVELIRAADDTRLWGGTYEGTSRTYLHSRAKLLKKSPAKSR